MKSNFKITSIQELEDKGIIKKIEDGNHGNDHPTSGDFIPAGIPFITARDLKNNSLNLETCNFLSKNQSDSLRIGFAKPGDVLLTHKGTMGRVAIVPEIQDYIMLSPQVTYYRTDDSALNNTFLFYAFQESFFQQQLDSFSEQTTRRYIGILEQRILKIRYTDIDTQKKIALILGKFDSLITNLKNQNFLLDQFLDALFKSWFVDFDGVKEFEGSELGSIPKGWKVDHLDNIAVFQNGLALQKYRPVNDSFLPVIKIREMKNGISKNTEKARIDLEEKYIVNTGDVLFSWSGTLELIFWSLSKGALNQHLFKVTSKNFSKWFYYMWIKFHLDEFRRIAEGKVTTMGHIQKHHLSEALVLIPELQVLEKMNNIMNPISEKIIQNKIFIENLSQNKNILLPKLMSGEIRV